MEKILDNRYYDLIISNVSAPLYNAGDNITPINEISSLLHVMKEPMDLCDLGQTPYYMFPALYTLESAVSMNQVPGVSQESPELGLQGRGVIVGIVDTGIDYTHPAFMHNDKTTRILSIWDQTQEDSIPPRGFNFGAEYTKELINFALLSDDPFAIVPTVDRIYHGTAVASVIAGRASIEHNFSGVVPEAELVVVKLKEAKQNLKTLLSVSDRSICYQESDIMLGIRYIVEVARRMNRPLVICLAIGSSQGGHDGRGPFSAYVDYLVQSPRIAVVVSGGNEGDNRRHYSHRGESSPYIHEFQLIVGRNDKKFFLEIWPYIPARLFIEIITPAFEISQAVYPSTSGCQKFTFQSNRAEVWVNNIMFEEESGEQLILVRFVNADPGTWRIRIGNSLEEPFSFHCWLPSGDLISNETYFPDSDPNTTITAPADALHSLAITAYNQQDGGVLRESGRGYTRLGQVKPDVTAPGYFVSCAIPQNQYGTITGTGAAAAHTTGIAAMIMEWAYSKGNYTSVTGNQINRLIIREAVREPGLSYPNQVWGYGTVAPEEIFQRLIEL